MKILVCAAAGQIEELRSEPIREEDILFVSMPADEVDISSFDAFFMLDHYPDADFFSKAAPGPVFINQTIATLKELGTASNVIRINGWPGFLQRPVWEAAGRIDAAACNAAAALGRKLIPVKDVVGMVSARVVSAIINEAFYALEEKISTREEIDTAMKLATNYPHGPFEWGNRIGLQKVYDLLCHMSADDPRYAPAFKP